MQKQDIRPKNFFIWGLEGSIIGGVIYFLILLLNDGTPLILEQLSYSSSFIFAIILVYTICIFFGLVYSIIMIQLNSRNIVTTDTIIKTLILGVLFGLSVYIIKEFAVFSWYLGLPSDTVIMGLVNLERETWLEFIGDILFGITIALIVRIGYERYIRRFKFSVKEN